MTHRRFLTVSCLLFLVLSLSGATAAQTQQQSTQVVVPSARNAANIAGRTNLYCAGYIKYQRFEPSPEIVGAER